MVKSNLDFIKTEGYGTTAELFFQWGFKRLFLFLNGFFKHPAIEVKTNLVNKAALFVAQNVSGAADFKVLKRNFKAGAKLAESFNRSQALFGVLSHHPVAGNQKVSVRLSRLTETADAAAQLIKIGKAEGVRAIDENRIPIGNVDSGVK